MSSGPNSYLSMALHTALCRINENHLSLETTSSGAPWCRKCIFLLLKQRSDLLKVLLVFLNFWNATLPVAPFIVVLVVSGVRTPQFWRDKVFRVRFKVRGTFPNFILSSALSSGPRCIVYMMIELGCSSLISRASPSYVSMIELGCSLCSHPQLGPSGLAVWTSLKKFAKWRPCTLHHKYTQVRDGNCHSELSPWS